MANKVIPSNYPSISHLPGSKLRDKSDRTIGEQEATWLTVQTRRPDDLVIVTEKVDGCNVGVLRRGDDLYPIIRKGYDVRTNPYKWIRDFALFVDENRDRFLRLLSNGERVCGEWMVKTHTIRYNMPHEPFVCFDIINGAGRVRYAELQERLNPLAFTSAAVVHSGGAISTSDAVSLLGSGHHGAVGAPEGVVYRYESKEHGWLFSAKFVSNPLVGDQELLDRNIKSGLMNTWQGGAFTVHENVGAGE